jgi:16S rRNA (uracil1498-N3)-methyltransferase
VSAAAHFRRAERLDRGRLERIALAAMKQSGRSWLPAVEDPVGVDVLVARFGGFTRVVLADPAGGAAPPPEARPPDTLAIVGPEAGFTVGETRSLVDAGAERVALSDHRLRAETAAIVLASLLAPRRRCV